MNFQNWLARWRLRRIIVALHHATDHGLKREVQEFARSLEATSMMTRSLSLKKDTPIVVSAELDQLNCFVAYMTRLHQSKLSLLYRARIGLATLAMADEHIIGETPKDFIRKEFPKSKSGKMIISNHR